MGTVRTDNVIVEMIDTCLNHRDEISPFAENFVESVNKFYEENGYLTEKHFKFLERIHDDL